MKIRKKKRCFFHIQYVLKTHTDLNVQKHVVKIVVDQRTRAIASLDSALLVVIKVIKERDVRLVSKE